MSRLLSHQQLWTKEIISQAQHFLITATEGKPETIGSPSSFLGYKISSDTGVEDEGIWAQWTWNGKQFELIKNFLPIFLPSE